MITIKRALEHQYLPVVLAAVACIIMLGSLKAGLLMDDFVQRVVLVDPSQVPAQLYQSGHLPDTGGRLSTAVFHLFGFSRSSQNVAQYKQYGLLPWWVHKDFRASLWRPVTALTHWLDYQVFPNAPALMHAHNILWFAAVIFSATVIYRRLMLATWIGGLAAVLYLLDENSYFPVMFIANRGFFLAIFFGMLTLLAHHRWRTANSLAAAIAAQLFLLLSLLSNEAGVTTFAYLLAYALTLERVSWPRRTGSMAPAVSVIVLWRVIYNLLGYGVYGGDLYIDPANEPVHYIVALVERVPIVLIGQLSGQSCDLYHFLSNSIRQKLSLLSIAFLALVFITLIPLLRKNRIARFWFIAMILSILPIATVAPMSKNLPFVGFAAFGLVASFVGGLLAKENWVPKSRMWRVAGWTVCIVFLVVHLPMAAAGRIMAPRMTSFAFDAMDPAIDIGSSRELEKQDLVLVNAPCQLAITVMPFLRAYKGQPLPRSVRTLAPGFRTLEVHRTGDKTLVLKTLSGDIFSCEHKSPLHTAYFFETLNVFRAKRFPFSAGDKIILPPLTVEVINVDRDGKATDVLFSFAVPLEDESLNWVWFNWNDGRYCSFEVPAIGESVEIAGPPPVSLHGAMKYVMNTLFQR